MSNFRKIVEDILHEQYQSEKLSEGGLGHTVATLNKNDYNICFITACTDYNSTEENLLANNSLEKDLRSLDHGFNKVLGGYQYKVGEVTEEPGFQVIDKRLSAEDFLDEMVALGKKYDQWAISIKPKNSNIRCIVTKPNDENFGKDDPSFNPNELKHANPKEPVNKDGQLNFTGYTRLQKDSKRNPTRAFQYTNKFNEKHLDLVDSLKEEQLINVPTVMYKHGRRANNLGNMSIQHSRQALGLSPFYKIVPTEMEKDNGNE